VYNYNTELKQANKKHISMIKKVKLKPKDPNNKHLKDYTKAVKKGKAIQGKVIKTIPKEVIKQNRDLTPKEIKLIELYLRGGKGLLGNMSECYKAVYGKKHSKELKRNSLWVIASNKFKEPIIKETIKQQVDAMTDKYTIKSGIRKETSTKHSRDRLKAWELLAKITGLMEDKQQNINIIGLQIPKDIR